MKLRIVGEDWKVKHVKSSPLTDEDTARGTCDGSKRRIVLGPHSGREDLLHEIIHAIEYSFNLDLDHKDLQIVARSLWAICQDNPQFIDYLAGTTDE